MDEGTARNAIDWFLESTGDYKGELKINFMGGEPLLRFDLIQKIVPYGKCRARQRGKSLHFGCTTNCTLLTEEMLEFWRRFGMGFHCSIDGVPEAQNANRPLLSGAPSSPSIEKNAKAILAYRPEVMARATLTPRSVPYLAESAKYLVGLGFRSITFRPAVNIGWTASDFQVLRTQYARLAEFYIDRLVSGQRIKIDELDKGIQALHSISSKAGPPCGAGYGLALVDPRGEIFPCHRFGPHLCGGQFRLGRLGEPFNDRLREVFLNYNCITDTKANCKDCCARITCHSWCYVECVDSTQTLYNPGQEYCEAMRILYDQISFVDGYLRLHHPEILNRFLKDGGV
jgi:uncharacterized protein